MTQRRPTWAEFRVVLPVLLFMTLSSLLIVGGIVGVRWVSSKALHGVDYMVIGILLVLFNYVWVGVLMVVVSPLRITAGSEGLSARWRAVSVPVWRRIVRSRLASIALAITRADNSHRPVLVVGRDDGRSIELAGGRADDLRYIATLLRRRLGVPAVAARREARPELDAAWHQTDDVQTQGTFDISVQDTAEGSVITVRQKYRWLGWVVAGAMLCAAAALQFVLRPHLTDIGAQVSMAISGVLAFLGVLYAGLGVLLERDRHVFRIDADSFTYARTSLMKPRTRRWRRAEIRAVGTEGIGPANMPRLRLVAWLTDERSVVLHQPRLATPRERREWRHIATLLRRRLGVPARPEE